MQIMTGFATCLVLLVLLGVGRATLLCDSRADATALVAATLASAADTRFLLRQAAPLVLVDHAALATLLTDKLHLLLAAPSGGVASVAASSDDVRVLYRPTAWASTAPLAYAPGSGNCTALGATLLADELPVRFPHGKWYSFLRRRLISVYVVAGVGARAQCTQRMGGRAGE